MQTRVITSLLPAESNMSRVHLTRTCTRIRLCTEQQKKKKTLEGANDPEKNTYYSGTNHSHLHTHIASPINLSKKLPKPEEPINQEMSIIEPERTQTTNLMKNNNNESSRETIGSANADLVNEIVDVKRSKIDVSTRMSRCHIERIFNLQ